jgi:hypothetical protein
MRALEEHRGGLGSEHPPAPDHHVLPFGARPRGGRSHRGTGRSTVREPPSPCATARSTPPGKRSATIRRLRSSPEKFWIVVAVTGGDARFCAAAGRDEGSIALVERLQDAYERLGGSPHLLSRAVTVSSLPGCTTQGETIEEWRGQRPGGDCRLYRGSGHIGRTGSGRDGAPSSAPWDCGAVINLGRPLPLWSGAKQPPM